MTLVQSSNQLEEALANILKLSDKLLYQYQNLLARETFDINRLASIGSFLPNPPAAGNITLRSKIVQPTLIETILYCAPVSPNSYTLTIGREVITRASRSDNLINQKFIVGPGDILSLAWTGATSTDTASFYLFGRSIGSVFAQ